MLPKKLALLSVLVNKVYTLFTTQRKINNFPFFVFLFLLLLVFSLVALSSSSSSPLSSPTTLIFTEGDLIKLQPQAQDPDQDKITFSYSPPLNESGQWQTTLNDAGTYHTKIIASDGLSQTEKELILIIQNKNQPPKIEKKKLIVEETETLDLKPIISDPDNDTLKFIFPPPFDEEGLWTPTYDDAGLYTKEITVSDLEFKTSETIEIEIKNKNRPPEILSSFSEEETLQLTENSTLPLSLTAQDLDQDPLTYTWQLDNQKISSQPSFDYFFDFNSAGEHFLTLTLSDQKSETKKTWTLNIANLNRPPQLEHPDILVNEGERIILQLPEKDLDNDTLTYTFQPPFQPDGIWQTDYDDAGESTALITATDGDLTTQKEIHILIKDVDRAPLLNFTPKIILDEEEELSLNLNDYIFDPDGDLLSLTLTNLPPGAAFEENQLHWQPDYDFVQRSPNFFTDFLNCLGIEKYLFPPRKKAELLITACGKELCSNRVLEIQVNNLNRPPSWEDLPTLFINETETAQLKPSASDPDHDCLHYSFEKPFNSQGEWSPDYETTKDAQTFNTTLLVSDGEFTLSRQLEVTVLNKNHPPTLGIKEDHFKIEENQTFSFELAAQDPDGDNLTLSVDNLPPSASFQDQLFSWTPSFDTVNSSQPSSSFILNFTASDSEFDVIHPVLITVKNVNRPPEIIDYSPTKALLARLNQPVTFFATFQDPDEENLTYQWSFGFWDKSLTGPHIIKRTFKTPGLKTVTLTATDGTSSLEQVWEVQVTSPPPAKPKVKPKPQTTPPKAPSTFKQQPSPQQPTKKPAAVSLPKPQPSSQPTPLPPSSPPQFKVYIVE